ncbi:sarcosine oxidase subunit delta [Gluconacetobacter tumulisoli]|uniref:Sarcosine oxidase subunit delta n=1 Tax=Gluconacetobacter tumulisoli TaxID=1286189 RepID=A0A7W4K8K7_9PROT|nr:sarcosine oxidase subunit delta [Gluconacetobacter tumulisoli]MBB2202377.1 sarcosine oxidase subunit delta [Gluconacetobacter tumulisoli]
MRITCPCCGERGLDEFSYRGDATLSRPAGDPPLPGAGAEAWAEYVYLRDNPSGPHRELWYHGAGCRSWLVVTRNTRTHEILDTERAVNVVRATRKDAEA